MGNTFREENENDFFMGESEIYSKKHKEKNDNSEVANTMNPNSG